MKLADREGLGWLSQEPQIQRISGLVVEAVTHIQLLAATIRFAAGRPSLGGRCRSDCAPLDSFADVGFEGAMIVRRCCKTWECAHPPHQPESSGIDTRPDTGVAALESNEGRDRYAQAFRPSPLRLPSADPRDGQIFAQGPEGLGGGRGQYL
jgi:hypothetical protein